MQHYCIMGKWLLLGVIFFGLICLSAAQPISDSLAAKSLRDTLRTLQTVEIQAKAAAASAGQSVSVLDAAALNAVRGKSLAESLEGLAGVAVLRTGNTISKPIIRGLYGSRVLILNNGVRHEAQQWGSEHAPEIDVFSAERLRVVKGAESVRYGAEAMGGVIVVEPASLRATQKLSGTLHVGGYGNGRRGIAAAQLQGAIPRIAGLAWRVQGSAQRGGDVRTAHYRLLNTGIAEANGAATLEYQHKKDNIQAYYSHFGSTVGIFQGAHIGNTTDLLAAISRPEPFPQFTPDTFSYRIYRPRQEIRHDLLKTAWERLLPDGTKYSVVYAYQRNLRDEFDAHRPRGVEYELPQLRFRMHTHTLDALWQHALRGQWTGTVGSSITIQQSQQLGRKLIPSFRSQQAGVFWMEKRIGLRHEWEIGARYDYKMLETETLTRHFGNGSLLASHCWRRGNVAWRSQLSSAWRAPNVNELFSNGVHHGVARFEVGNAHLRPEKAFTANTSLEYQHKKIAGSLQLYVNYLKDYIYARPTMPPVLTIRGAFLSVAYTQTDALFCGADADYTFRFAPAWAWRLQAALLYVRDTRANRYLIGIAPNRLSNSLAYTHALSPTAHSTRSLSATLGSRWVARQTHVPAGTAEQPTDFLPPPAAYHLLDASVVFRHQPEAAAGDARHAFSFTIESTNLLNTRYRDYLDAFRYYCDAVGRSINFRFQFNFL